MRPLATLLLIGFGYATLVYGKTTNICSLPSVTGRCRALFFRYYFNTRTGACEMFVYGGCGGNGNNFGTLEECQRTCPSIEAKTADTTQIRRPSAVTFPDICSLVRCAAAECENPIPPNPDEGKCCYTCPRQTSRTANIEADRSSSKISFPILINRCVGVFCAEQIIPLPCDNPIRPDGACCSRCPTATELADAETTIGQCPPILPNTFGTCAIQCFGDGSCRFGEKCCSNGCGYSCQPVTMKAAAQTRQSGAVSREMSSASVMKSLLELAALVNKLEE